MFPLRARLFVLLGGVALASIALTTRVTDESMGILMLDLGHFKEVDDRHGHPAGDEALRVFAGVLRSCMRDGDIGARYGGEEFAVLLSRVDGSTALQVAERIRTRTESTLISLTPGVTERLTVSIGLAMAPDQGIEPIVPLRVADEALYFAKQGGRNRAGYLRDASTTLTPPMAPVADTERPASTFGAA